jgi:hypothetical protein
VTAVSAGAGLAECLCGLAVIGLAIAGLANAIPTTLSGIAQIVFGIGLLCGDAGVAAFFARSRQAGRLVHVRFAGGFGVGAIGGLAGIILGILTLVGLVPVVLSAVSVIVFGTSVILAAAPRGRVALRAAYREGWTYAETEMAEDAHATAIGGRALIGLAAIVLGIIGVVLTGSATDGGDGGMVLALVGLLCLGAGSALTGAALSSQVVATPER